MRESWSVRTNVAIRIFALLWYNVLPTTGNPISNHSNSLYVLDVVRISKAAEMHAYMKEDIDPCDDFYEFSCGNWAKINPASTTDTTSLFQLLIKAFDRKIKNFLESNADSQDTEIDIKVKDFYASCTQMEKLKSDSKLYHDELAKIVDEFGGMPANSGGYWNADKFNWLETIAKIAHKYGKNIILNLSIKPDLQNASVSRLYIGHQDFELTATEIQRKEFQEKISNDLTKHLNLSQQLAKDTAKEIVDFEVALALGLEDTKKGLSMAELCERTSVDKLSQKYDDAIDIWELVTIRFGEEVHGPIYECVEKYQENLIEIMKEKPRRIVANYIMYSLLRHFWLETADTQSEQEKACVATTKTYFPKNLNNVIYRRFNTELTKRDVNLIWNGIKQTFMEELLSDKLNWMTNEVRNYAIEKLDSLQLEINSYMNDNFTEKFGPLVIERNDYLKNIKNIFEHNNRRVIAKLYEKPQLENAETFSYTPVNSMLENVLKVPVAILQPYYLWAERYPNALKFGSLGALIGHELIHGFDDTGRKYDIQGNSVNWWDDQTDDSFKDLTECFIDQYSKYSYNSTLDLQTENIADNGGVRLAYQAYLKWFEQFEKIEDELYLETLPKLNYTNTQLFFISWAQLWCNDIHPDKRQPQAGIDSRVPGKYRVIGALSNFPEFAKEFNCAKGTLMNKNKTCEIY